jgi:hypothetical protein
VTPNYTVSHQWLRELKRGGAKTLVAVVFRVDDDEVVFARHYSEVPREMSAAAAVGVILSHPEALGYEVMIPRRIKPSEIVAVRHVAQKLGWRTIPGTQKVSLCTCPVCVPPGTVTSSRRRAQFEEAQAPSAIAGFNTSRAARRISAAPAVLSLRSAYAQAGGWQEYRRNDLGFRVEMPGEPRVETEQDDQGRFVHATVEYEETSFGINWQEWSRVQSEEEFDAYFRKRMRVVGMDVTRETRLLVNGVLAHEYAGESDGINYISRIIVMGKEAIAVIAIGDQGVHNSPTVRRFLDSFAVLGGAR